MRVRVVKVSLLNRKFAIIFVLTILISLGALLPPVAVYAQGPEGERMGYSDSITIKLITPQSPNILPFVVGGIAGAVVIGLAIIYEMGKRKPRDKRAYRHS